MSVEGVEGDGHMTSPSITPIAEEALPTALRTALQPRVERLGYLGMFFRCAAHQPDALLAFMRFTDELKAGVTSKHTEIVALTVAVALGNDYERNQHERLCDKLRFSRTWIQQVEALDPAGASALTPEERAVARLAIKLVEGHGIGAADEVAAVVDAVGERETVGVVMLVGRYMAHAVMANAFELVPPVGSIFEDEER